MNRRLELHKILIDLLGSSNVYYQPPEGLKMEYPCIRYNRSNINSGRADNFNYRNMNQYTIYVIDKKPDNPVIEKILGLERTSFDRHYVADNLNHDVLTIYF
jgi:hypothetical protein